MFSMNLAELREVEAADIGESLRAFWALAVSSCSGTGRFRFSRASVLSLMLPPLALAGMELIGLAGRPAKPGVPPGVLGVDGTGVRGGPSIGVEGTEEASLAIRSTSAAEPRNWLAGD